MSYLLRLTEQELNISNLFDLEKNFKVSMTAEGHSKEADFILGGANQEHTLQHDTADFNE